MEAGNRFTLVTTAKNEGPYFLEWIAYHRLIGFDNIIVFQNDSPDGSDPILKCLRSMGIISYKYNRAVRGRHQIRAYTRATKLPEYADADWIMALDMDEFLCLHAPITTLNDWFAKLPDADRIFVNWAVFGNSGHTDLTSELVTSRFKYATQREGGATEYRAFKTMFRRLPFFRPGVHQPKMHPGAQNVVRSINGSGVTEDAFLRLNFRCTDPKNAALAQVNHYMVRDAASFVVKSWKGSAHQAHRDIGKKYWIRGNRNQAVDTSLVVWSDRIKEEMARLDAQSGGVLMKLRAESIAWHRRQFHEIIKDEQYRELYSYCCLNDGEGSIL